MKLSVVIVSWNVRDLLQQCLESLFLHGLGSKQEICVIDNASTDGSDVMIKEKFPPVRLIANHENRGFGAACNQGIAASLGEYILFLNPDTLVTADAIRQLVAYLDCNPQVGLVAPRLLNVDGSVQPSVRKFPGIWSSLAMFFQWKPVQYAPNTTQSIEQPQGACMLIRRCVLDSIGIFDEQYFLWFEEVDLCKRIKDGGHDSVYLPTAQVKHVGGKSFDQRKLFEKQNIFYTSFAHYLWKHFGWRSILPVFLMRWYTSILSRPFLWISLAGILASLCISLIGYFFEYVTYIGFWVITLFALLLSLKDLSYGFFFLFAELLIGSKGYLFSFPIPGFDVSLRMALFGVIFLAWIYHSVRTRTFPRFFQSSFALWYGLLALAYVWGLARGFLNGNDPAFIFKDANGWLFFLLALPFYDAFTTNERIKRLFHVIGAGLIAHIMLVALMLYIMSHASFGYDVLYPFYRWIRESGIGEITRFEWGGVRVFLQSSIYLLLALFFFLPPVTQLLCRGGIPSFFKNHWQMTALIAGCAAVFLLSFSRSFWFAGAILGVLWALRALVRKNTAALKAIGVYMICICIGVLGSMAISLFPLPSPDGGMGLDAFARRLEDLDSEAAAASRWNLLPVLEKTIQESPWLGHGFGKTVTYISHDPRVREGNATGAFTTYAFEWGYLDILIKLGIPGFIIVILFFDRIARTGIEALKKTRSVRIHGFLLGFGALLLVHLFTPYLNHPLGIAYVFLVGLLFERALSVDTLTESPIGSAEGIRH